MHYEVRNSLVDKTTRYSLEDTALTWAAPGRTGRLAYEDIAQVKLLSYPGGGGNTLQCKIKGKNGERLTLRSHHFVSLGAFESRIDAYGPFMRAFMQRIAAKAPNAKCLAGSTALTIVWLIVALIFALGVLLVVIIVFDAGGTSGSPGLWGFVGLLVVGTPFVYRQIKRGGTHHFDPADPPSELITGDPQNP